jgi:hypothetical protein
MRTLLLQLPGVLLQGITFSLKPQHSVQGQEASKLDPNLFEQLFQELRDIAFKEDLVEKFKGLSLKVNFNARGRIVLT